MSWLAYGEGVDMDVSDPKWMYGEPVTDDECLCDDHGCRLMFHYIKGWICPECEVEGEYEYLEDLRERYEKEMAMETAMQEHDLLHGGNCTFIQTKQYNAFQCKMPWWA